MAAHHQFLHCVKIGQNLYRAENHVLLQVIGKLSNNTAHLLQPTNSAPEYLISVNK